jgi:hypothetical protein
MDIRHLEEHPPEAGKEVSQGRNPVHRRGVPSNPARWLKPDFERLSRRSWTFAETGTVPSDRGKETKLLPGHREILVMIQMGDGRKARRLGVPAFNNVEGCSERRKRR